jgi:hypothetical protein
MYLSAVLLWIIFSIYITIIRLDFLKLSCQLLGEFWDTCYSVPSSFICHTTLVITSHYNSLKRKTTACNVQELDKLFRKTSKMGLNNKIACQDYLIHPSYQWYWLLVMPCYKHTKYIIFWRKKSDFLNLASFLSVTFPEYIYIYIYIYSYQL